MNSKSFSYRLRWRDVLVALFICSFPYSGSAADNRQSGNWDVSVKIDIDWVEVADQAKAGATRLYKLWFTTHKNAQAIYKINGKAVVVVPLDRGAGGTRITYNINMDEAWKGMPEFKKTVPAQILVANVPNGADPRAMVFQQKWDAERASDPNKGPQLRHGDTLDFDWGHNRYFAKRNDTVYWGASILIIQKGITIDEINSLPGIKVRL